MKLSKISSPFTRDLFISLFLVSIFKYSLESFLVLGIVILIFLDNLSLIKNSNIMKRFILIVIAGLALKNLHNTQESLILLALFFNILTDIISSTFTSTKDTISNSSVWMTTITISLASLSFYSFLGYRFFFSENTFSGIFIILIIGLVYNFIQGNNHIYKYKGGNN